MTFVTSFKSKIVFLDFKEFIFIVFMNVDYLETNKSINVCKFVHGSFLKCIISNLLNLKKDEVFVNDKIETILSFPYNFSFFFGLQQ